MRDLMAVAAPMMISTGCDTAMIFTSRLFLSHLGPEQMNASLVGGLASLVTGTLFLGTIGFTTALVAQHLGAGQRNRCSLATTQAIIIALIAWPLLICLRPVFHAIFAASGVEPRQLALQNEYFDICNTWYGVFLLRSVMASFFSGIGQTRVVMVSTIVAMTVNILASWLLIFGHAGFPELGMRGAAWGNVIGCASGLVILICVYLTPAIRKTYSVMRSWYFDASEMRTLLRYGLPGGIEFMLNLLAFSAMIDVYHAHAPMTATATTLVFNWDIVCFVPLVGLQIGVSSLVGRAMGAGSPETAKRVVRSGIMLGMMYSGVVLIAFVGAPQALVSMFQTEQVTPAFTTSAALAADMLRIAAAYVLMDAVVLVVSGALRAAGDAFFTMCISVGLHWMPLPIVIIGLHYADWTPLQVWSLQIVLYIVGGSLFWLRWRAGRWQGISVVGKTGVES